VKHSHPNWIKDDQRPILFQTLARLPLSLIAVLLEDFRPRGMQLHKETRADAYVHRVAFDYALQRIVRWVHANPGPHIVDFDDRDDFARLEQAYANGYKHGWDFGRAALLSLREAGFVAVPHLIRGGPLAEIADVIVSGFTL
jgi:hypothetical protein